jgi:hypothetical protein
MFDFLSSTLIKYFRKTIETFFRKVWHKVCGKKIDGPLCIFGTFFEKFLTLGFRLVFRKDLRKRLKYFLAVFGKII